MYNRPAVVSTLLALLQLKVAPNAVLLACVRWLVYKTVILFLEELKKKKKKLSPPLTNLIEDERSGFGVY